MRANVVKTVVNSVPHEGIDAVGVERTIPENPLRRKSDQKHWYIAIVNKNPVKPAIGSSCMGLSIHKQLIIH